ncbi:PASTA domain-containing protein [Kitasatospora purpeofusca]|uniref:PASTA domain-containing protein n=1 Tax=Kitasatospora purpeofusca TaxID=67352 RepID=UPI00364C58DA
MAPGVITDTALQYWVQIGAGIYDAADIVRRATGREPANPQVCVIALRRLGFFPLQRVRFDGAKVAAVPDTTWHRCSYDVTQQRPGPERRSRRRTRPDRQRDRTCPPGKAGDEHASADLDDPVRPDGIQPAGTALPEHGPQAGQNPTGPLPKSPLREQPARATPHRLESGRGMSHPWMGRSRSLGSRRVPCGQAWPHPTIQKDTTSMPQRPLRNAAAALCCVLALTACRAGAGGAAGYSPRAALPTLQTVPSVNAPAAFPSLIGLPLNQASAKLRLTGHLNIWYQGPGVEQASDDQADLAFKNNMVCKQDPDPGTRGSGRRRTHRPAGGSPVPSDL